MKRNLLLFLTMILLSMMSLTAYAANVITLTTSSSTIDLKMVSKGTVTITGATGTYQSGKTVTYTVTSQTIKITGDVTYFQSVNNSMTALDVTENTVLTYLDCYKNQLTKLNLEYNTELLELNLGYNNITSLDLSYNHKLKVAQVFRNSLTSLNVTGCTKLIDFNCFKNKLKNLDLSHCVEVTSVVCASNQLTSINVDYNTKLTYLDVSDNAISQLNVSHCTLLETLYCFDNKINETNMGVLVKSLVDRSSMTKKGDLSVLDLDKDNGKDENNYINYIQVNIAIAHGWNVRDSRGENTYGYMTEYINMNTSLPVGSSIQLYISATGDVLIEGATGSYQSKRRVTYTTTSKKISIYGKVLALNCENNSLTSIDLTQGLSLEDLYCDGNLLNSLDVTKNKSLKNLWCYGCKIRGDAMDALIKSLVNRTGLAAGDFVVAADEETDANRNICTTVQVAAAKAKNWTSQYRKSNATYVTYPGVNFITMTTSKPLNSTSVLAIEANGIVTIDGLTGNYKSGEAITYITTSKTITIAGDVTSLFCMDEQLTDLDVSNDPALKILACDDNPLTKLDVSKNPNLTTLFCDNNSLTNLDVSNNPKLTELYCSKNKLTSLDLSKNKELMKLYCYGNQIKGAKMDALIASLVDRSSMDQNGVMVGIDPTNASESNVITKTQVAAAKKRGWDVYCIDPSAEIGISPYAGSVPSAINDVQTDDNATIMFIYDLSGRRIPQLQHGVNIVKMSNGKTIKIKKLKD